jgi:N-acyl-L-homoserine lactone synthetase
MIQLIQGAYPGDNADILDKMFRLRAKVFNDRLGWEVNVRDNRETDRFDELNPLYVVETDEKRNVLASLRLLPTTGPHMLSDVFSELMAPESIVRSPRVIEGSRFAADTELLGHLPNGLSTVTGALLCATLETARAAGVDFVISVYDVRVERILRRAGCGFERLCEPKNIGNVMTVVGLFETATSVTDEIRARNRLTGSLFADPAWMTSLPVAA